MPPSQTGTPPLRTTRGTVIRTPGSTGYRRKKQGLDGKPVKWCNGAMVKWWMVKWCNVVIKYHHSIERARLGISYLSFRPLKEQTAKNVSVGRYSAYRACLS